MKTWCLIQANHKNLVSIWNIKKSTELIMIAKHNWLTQLK